MNSIITLKQMLGAAVLSILFFVQLQAAKPPVFTIINAGLGQQFGLKVHQFEEEQALFKVSNRQGDVLLSQRIAAVDYSGLYSLEGLNEGEYIFILETSSNAIRQPVRLTKRAILYQLSQRQVIHYPEVVQKGRQVDVNYLNPSREKFTIKLLNHEGDVLYKEEFVDLDDIEKRLNLLQLPAGSYLVRMLTRGDQWSKELQLD